MLGAMAATMKAAEANKYFTRFDLQGFITNVEVSKNKEIPSNGGYVRLSACTSTKPRYYNAISRTDSIQSESNKTGVAKRAMRIFSRIFMNRSMAVVTDKTTKMIRICPTSRPT